MEEANQHEAFQALQKALKTTTSDEWGRMVLYKAITKRLFEREPELAMEILREVAK